MQKYHLGYVYFIQCEAEPKMIKIGWSRKYPDERLASLQTANPFKLMLIGYMRGCRSDEHAVHFVFKDTRHIGEWFRNTPELSEFIAKHGHSDAGERSEFFRGMPEPNEFVNKKSENMMRGPYKKRKPA